MRVCNCQENVDVWRLCGYGHPSFRQILRIFLARSPPKAEMLGVTHRSEACREMDLEDVEMAVIDPSRASGEGLMDISVPNKSIKGGTHNKAGSSTLFVTRFPQKYL